jgi:DNA repair exonuclease SbcCD ATPase subunit
MTDRATAEIPLEVDRIESSRADADTIRLRLAGRWLDPAGAVEEELLVVQVDGRRHRFPATRDPQPRGSGAWSASFELPVWAEPRHAGQAALWLGDAVIPVPSLHGTGDSATSTALGRAVAPPEAGLAPAAPELPASPAPEPPAYAAPETPRSGPLADLLLKETVAALHEELERRTAELARIRGALADAHSDLESRGAMQAALEDTHAELRAQLERLTGAVGGDRAELARRTSELEQEQSAMAAIRGRHDAEIASLRDQLARAMAGEDRDAVEVARLREAVAAASVARDAAVSEAAGLRTELARLGTELAAVRERVSAESGDLGEAQRLLADARALADELGAGDVPG